MIVRRMNKLGVTLGAIVVACSAGAQFWDVCFDPANTQPISLDWLIVTRQNAIFRAGVGVSGTVSWGPDSPCGEPPGNDPEPTSGYLMYLAGFIGSDLTAIDDQVALSMGAPFAGNNWSYVTIRVTAADGTGVQDTKWGAGGVTAYGTASQRDIIATAPADGGVTANLKMSIVGNAARMEWTLTNNNADAVRVGLRHATWWGMLNRAGSSSGWANNNYVMLPNGRPLLVERSFVRAQDPINFPKKIDFHFRQASPIPSVTVITDADQDRLPFDLTDALNRPTPADQISVSNYLSPSGGMSAGLWDFGVGTSIALGSTAFGLFFNPVIVPGGQSRRIVYYIVYTMQAGDLKNITDRGGYGLALEMPNMVAWNSVTSTLQPNPFRVLCWMDNLYGWVDGSSPEELTDIRMTCTLPPGLTFAPGETPTKTLGSLQPVVADNLEWNVIADGNRPGVYPISISVAPGPNARIPFQQKTIVGSIVVAATPTQNFVIGPNLISNPWVLANPNMQVATGLTSPGDFVAWNWDVLTQSYVPATNFVRGRGQWMVMNNNFPANSYIGATASGQDVPGGFTFTVRRGWNLIGNPNLYPVQLNQVHGISSFNPNEVLTWVELTQRGWIRSTVFSYDTSLSDYVFSSNAAQLLPPHVGFWIFVNTESTITLLWPAIYIPGLPGSLRATSEWGTPTQNKWRVQFVLRGEGGSDSSNYLGVAPDAPTANELSAPKPPMAPGSNQRLSFVREATGDNPIYWAQDIRQSGGIKRYKLQANVNQPGTYTITWPNIAQMPNNMRARIVDKSNNQSRDLRMASAYTFTMPEAGARQFEVIVEPGSVSRAVIASVMVSGSSRDPHSPITIQYSLSTPATVTTRILSNAGREIFTMTRGRAENAGLNTVVWNKRMTDGTSVAPGNYMVEIVAETSEGQRVRVTRPVVVTR